jgi:hypothetical protein
MCRSIVVKGLEALLFECVLAAVPYDADERVFATLEESMPGERRARELEIGRGCIHFTVHRRRTGDDLSRHQAAGVGRRA